MKPKSKNRAAVALGLLSAEARRKKWGKSFNQKMRKIAKNSGRPKGAKDSYPRKRSKKGASK